VGVVNRAISKQQISEVNDKLPNESSIVEVEGRPRVSDTVQNGVDDQIVAEGEAPMLTGDTQCTF